MITWLKSIALDETSHDQALSVEGIMSNVVLREASVLPEEERAALVARLVAEARGLGAVEALMRDPAVTEVMVALANFHSAMDETPPDSWRAWISALVLDLRAKGSTTGV